VMCCHPHSLLFRFEFRRSGQMPGHRCTTGEWHCCGQRSAARHSTSRSGKQRSKGRGKYSSNQEEEEEEEEEEEGRASRGLQQQHRRFPR
jgi:hypothetical protein